MNKSYSNSRSVKSDKSFASMDSTALRNNIQEYYKTSKEKLMKLKAEIEEIDQENEKQKMENKLQEEKINELALQNEHLLKSNKEMRANIFELYKKKSSLIAQNRDLNKEIEELDKAVESVKVENNYKIKVLQNDIDHINNLKENNVKLIKSKIEYERSNEDKLNETSKEYRKEISKFRALIDELHNQDCERNRLLVKETIDMTKFLSEL